MRRPILTSIWDRSTGLVTKRHRKVIFMASVFVGMLLIGWKVWKATNSTPRPIVQSAVQIIGRDLDHPFTIEATQLLNVDQMKKDEYVSRLDRYDIYHAFKEAFACEDLDVEFSTVLAVGHMRIPVTGYDPQKRVGYIWIDRSILGDGLVEGFEMSYPSMEAYNRDVRHDLDKGIELFVESPDHFIDEVFGKMRAEDKGSLVDDEMDVRRIEREMNWHFLGSRYRNRDLLYQWGLEIRSGLSRLSTYEDKKEYMEIILMEIKKEIAYADLVATADRTVFEEWKLTAFDRIEDPVRIFGFLESMKSIGVSVATDSFTATLSDEVFKIVVAKDSDEWWARSNALVDLFQANRTMGLKVSVEYATTLTSIMKDYNYTQWKEQYYRVAELSNRLTLSKDELLTLPSLQTTYGISLAPLSIRDDRVIYDMKDEEYHHRLATLRGQIDASNDPETREELYQSLLKMTSERASGYGAVRSKAKAVATTKLLEDVKSFIIYTIEYSDNSHDDIRA